MVFEVLVVFSVLCCRFFPHGIAMASTALLSIFLPKHHYWLLFSCVLLVGEAARAHGLIEHQSGSARRSVRALILVLRSHLVGAVCFMLYLWICLAGNVLEPCGV